MSLTMLCVGISIQIIGIVVLVLMIWNYDSVLEWEKKHFRNKKKAVRRQFASTEYKQILCDVERQQMIELLKKY